MKINTALILCAGLGKRLNPLTLKTPKPLLELNNVAMLENCIKMLIKLGIKKVFLNTFHLSNQILKFIEKKNFSIDIQVIDDGKIILDTGGGILNMINNSKENDFLVLNPDTLWNEKYVNEINKMQSFYFLNKKNCILLIANKILSFDKNLEGDFSLKDNLLKKDDNKNFIYIGCQILNRSIFDKYNINKFSITSVWNDLLNTNELYGFESLNKFYHLTNFEVFKKLQDF
tara:strand:+ start:634 stop:1323 length:690 start_codon:yes stop_codon:yes gene_type:complete